MSRRVRTSTNTYRITTRFEYLYLIPATAIIHLAILFSPDTTTILDLCVAATQHTITTSDIALALYTLFLAYMLIHLIQSIRDLAASRKEKDSPTSSPLPTTPPGSLRSKPLPTTPQSTPRRSALTQVAQVTPGRGPVAGPETPTTPSRSTPGPTPPPKSPRTPKAPPSASKTYLLRRSKSEPDMATTSRSQDIFAPIPFPTLSPSEPPATPREPQKSVSSTEPPPSRIPRIKKHESKRDIRASWSGFESGDLRSRATLLGEEDPELETLEKAASAPTTPERGMVSNFVEMFSPIKSVDEEAAAREAELEREVCLREEREFQEEVNKRCKRKWTCCSREKHAHIDWYNPPEVIHCTYPGCSHEHCPDCPNHRIKGWPAPRYLLSPLPPRTNASPSPSNRVSRNLFGASPRLVGSDSETENQYTDRNVNYGAYRKNWSMEEKEYEEDFDSATGSEDSNDDYDEDDEGIDWSQATSRGDNHREEQQIRKDVEEHVNTPDDVVVKVNIDTAAVISGTKSGAGPVRDGDDAEELDQLLARVDGISVDGMAENNDTAMMDLDELTGPVLMPEEDEGVSLLDDYSVPISDSANIQTTANDAKGYTHTRTTSASTNSTHKSKPRSPITIDFVTTPDTTHPIRAPAPTASNISIGRAEPYTRPHSSLDSHTNTNIVEPHARPRSSLGSRINNNITEPYARPYSSADMRIDGMDFDDESTGSGSGSSGWKENSKRRRLSRGMYQKSLKKSERGGSGSPEKERKEVKDKGKEKGRPAWR